MRHINGVPKRELLYVLWKLMSEGHGRALHQHRNDWDITFKDRSNFYCDPIVWIIDSALPFLVGRIEPVSADQYQGNSARRQILIDHFAEITTYLDSSDIHKDGRLAEMFPQIIKKAARLPFAIFSSIV